MYLVQLREEPTSDELSTFHGNQSTMRRTTVIVLVAAELTLMLRCLEYLSCCHISDSFVWSAAGLLPDYIGGDRDSVITGNLVLLKSAKVRKRISLDVLTGEQGQNVSCPPNTKPIFNNPGINVNASSSYKIPFVIHQTFKSRCVSDEFYQLTLAWKGLGIPYYFHDDAAIERLAQSHFKEFPLLQLIWDHCITKPVVKTDLWRLLLLYEYGGIYADLDTKPVSFQPSTTFRMEDEMYTVPDQVGLPSFHFIASMPRHPVSFLTVQLALDALLYTPDTGSYNPAKKTGKAGY